MASVAVHASRESGIHDRAAAGCELSALPVYALEQQFDEDSEIDALVFNRDLDNSDAYEAAEDELYKGAFDTCSNTEVGCFDASPEVGFMHSGAGGGLYNLGTMIWYGHRMMTIVATCPASSCGPRVGGPCSRGLVARQIFNY